MIKIFKKTVSFAMSISMLMSTASVLSEVSLRSYASDGLFGLSVQEIVKEMGIGWNLGNSLDCSGVNFKEGEKTPEWYETAWSNPVTTKAMIDRVKAEGFNTIRIPVTWGEKVSGSDYKIDPAWMARVKEIVDWAYEDDMFVILNTHHEEMTGFEEAPEGTNENLKYKSGWLRLENYESSSAELVAIWKQIAVEFADYDQHLIFEVLNEPRYVDEQGNQDWDGNSEWYDVINKLNADGLKAIRSVNGNEERAVMLPTYAAQLKEAPIAAFELPDDDNLIVSIHAYEPYDLCLAKGDEGEDYTTAFTDEGKALLDTKFALLDKYFINKGIPVVIGETSITNRNNPDDRRAWCEYYAGLARERTIPLVIWDANKFGKDNPKAGENHGWLNRNLMKWYDKQTTDTLVYSYYGYDVPGDDYYYPDEDLEPTDDLFDITTLWEGNATAIAWGQCTTIQLPCKGISASDMMKKGTLIEIDYDVKKGGAPHLVFYSFSPNAWVDIYPTDVDTVNGKAYFAYPTIVNTWEGMTGTTDFSSVKQIFPVAAFTPVTGTALKVCIPKDGVTVPDPYVDPYEDRNFWDEHTVYGPDGDDSSSRTDSSSKVVDTSSDINSSSNNDSSSKNESSSNVDSSSKVSDSSSKNDSSSKLNDSSSKNDSSSESDNNEDVKTVWTGKEELGGFDVDVDFSGWSKLAIRVTLSNTSNNYAGMQIAGYDAKHDYASIQGWTEITGKSVYERSLSSSELSKFSNIKTLNIQGTGTTVTKVELIGTKKGGDDTSSSDDTSSVADSSSNTDSSSIADSSSTSRADSSSRSDSSSTSDSSNTSGVTGDELGEVTFNSGKGLPWHVCESMTGKMKFDISGGTYNITIVNPGGKTNGGEDRWDCQFRHRGLTLEEGHTYRITYSIKTSKPGYMYAKIGNMVNDDQELWHGNGLILDMPTLSNDATQEEVESALRNAKSTETDVKYYQGWNSWQNSKIPANQWVTAAYEFKYYENSNDGVSSDHWAGTVDGTAEYTFHLGGDGQYTPNGCFPAGTELQFDNMALIDLTDDVTNYPVVEPYERNKILVNQVGYVAGLEKKATLVVNQGDDTPKTFKIISTKTGKSVYTGKTTPKGFDADSGDYVHIIDFTKFNSVDLVAETSGQNTGAYYIECDGETSYSFNIGSADKNSSNGIFSGMFRDAMNYFYQNRSGIDIESKYITSGDREKLAHAGAHNPDLAYIQNDWIKAYAGDGSDIQKDNGTLDVTGGWYDAGDHGKYVLNGGISVWTLQNMYERAKLVTKETAKFDDGALSIPESGNGFPDLLDEARYELEFMLKMQRSDGMVYHKMHDYKWTGLAVAPADDTNTRIIKPVSTCATLNLAASAAQAYRLWKGIDDDFAQQCLTAAIKAYDAAKKDPHNYAPIDQAIGGGAYGDTYAEDDFYWAACELYAATSNSKYYNDLKSYKNTCEGAPDDDKAFSITTSLYGGENGGSKTSFTWGSTAGLGTLTLTLHQDMLTTSEAEMVKDSITKAADEYISIENNQGYGIPYLPTSFTDETNAPGEVFEGYEWGSNSMVINNAMVMAYAADINKDNADKYASGVTAALDYIFGRNAIEYSYVTGYGDHATQYVHHRYWSGLLDSSFPFAPSGVLSGGANSGMQDPWIKGAGYKTGELAPQLCYLDHVESWSTNECTINWNAPFAWVVNFIEDYQVSDISEDSSSETDISSEDDSTITDESSDIDSSEKDDTSSVVDSSSEDDTSSQTDSSSVADESSSNDDSSEVDPIPVEKPSFVKSTFSLEGVIGAKLQYKVADAYVNGDYEIEVTAVSASGEEQTLVFDKNEKLDSNYVVTLPVKATDLTAEYEVTLAVKDAKGNEVASVDTTITVNAALNLLKSSPETGPLANALQTYGYYAQMNFGLEASDPIRRPADLSGIKRATVSAYKAQRNTVDNLPKSVPISTQSLLFEGQTTIRVYFGEIPENVDISKLKMVYTANGKTERSELQNNGTGYYADIANINAQELSNMYSIHVEEAGVQVSDELVYGAYSYVAANISSSDVNLQNTVKALYNYGEVAKAYFG